MAKNAHLTLDERASIQVSLRERKTFSEIAKELGKDPSTISKEVRNHFKVEEPYSFNPCKHRRTCSHRGDACFPCRCSIYTNICAKCYQHNCFTTCPDYEELICVKKQKPPYVCNGCKNKAHCKLQRHKYDAKYAQKEYEATRSESRQGFAITPEELKRIDAIISPLIQQGHSIHSICVSKADQLMLDEKTIYNYIDAGLLSAKNIDLPRKVRYRIRKKKKQVKVDKKCHIGRTYEDFLEFMNANPDIPVVEMDTVEGRKGGKVFLTIFLRNCSLLLAFIRDHNTARSVTDIFDDLYDRLGHDLFTALFQVILTDRGSEFSDPLSIEFTDEGVRRTRIFYCDPQRSDQKGGIEVAHEFIRRILPKKSSFDELSQTDVDRKRLITGCLVPV